MGASAAPSTALLTMKNLELDKEFDTRAADSSQEEYIGGQMSASLTCSDESCRWCMHLLSDMVEAFQVRWFACNDGPKKLERGKYPEVFHAFRMSPPPRIS
jgi:hypothetical protein